MYRMYKVIFEDSQDVYRDFVPASSEKDAESYVRGNGNIIAIVDVTDEFPISLDKVWAALYGAGFGDVERCFIERLLMKYVNCMRPGA